MVRLTTLVRVSLTSVLVWCAAASASAQTHTFSVVGPGTPVNLGTYSIGPLEIGLYGTGSPGPFTFDVVGGALPPGMVLRTDLPWWWDPGVTAVLSGVVTPGTYTVVLRVSDGALSADYNTTFKISPLTAMDRGLPDAFVGQAYTYTFTPLGNIGLVTFAATSGMPAGLSLSADGVLSGTPSASGFSNLQFTMTDGADTVWRYVGFDMYDVNVAGPAVLPNGTQGAFYTTTITASGGSGGYTFSGFGLPNGLSLDSGGTISGTISSFAQPGPYSLSVTARDSANASYTKRLSIDVIGTPPTLPSVIPYGNAFDDCTIGESCNRGIGVVRGGTAPFTWTASGLPPGMAIRFDGDGVPSWWIAPGDAETWGTPTATGNFDVEVTVTDANLATATNTFSLNVSTLVMTGSLANGTLNSPYSQTLRVIGGTGAYTVGRVGGSLPAGLTLNHSSLTVTGTPAESGDFSPVFMFSDGSETLTITNYFSIAGAGTGGVSINTGSDLGDTTTGSFYSTTLNACCAGSGITFSQIGGTLPPGVSLSAGGLLSGNASTTGTFSFLVKATDNGNAANFAVRQFTISVTPLSVTTNSTLPSGNVGAPYTAALAATGGTGALNWTVNGGSDLPPGMSLASNGTLSGTPTASGQYSFTLNILDTVPNLRRHTFTLSIYPIGAAPPLFLNFGPNLGNLNVGPRTYQLSATGGVPPYTYSLTPGADVVPGMRVQSGPPLPTFFSGSGTGGYIGVLPDSAIGNTYNTSIRVTDSLGVAFDTAVSLTVVGFDLNSQPSLPRPVAGTPYSFTLVPYPAAGSYSWSATNMPGGLSVHPTTGVISGTPNFGFFSPSVTLTDTVTGRSITTGITINVSPFAITTAGVLPQGTQNTPYNQALLAPGCTGTCTWSTVGSPPVGLSLSSAGVISGTPNSPSSTTFTAQVNGSNGSAQKVMSLIIASSSPQPLQITTAASLFATVGTVTNVSLNASGGTPPYSTWTVQSGTLPPGLELAGPGENFGFFLSPGFTYLLGRPRQVGSYTFTLQVTDAAAATTTRTFTVNVSPVSIGYSSLPLSGTTLRYNTPYTQPVLATGGAPPYTWTVNAGSTMPPGLTLSSSGVISGTPANTGSFNVPITVAHAGDVPMSSTLNVNIAGPTGTLVNFGLGANLGTRQQGNSITFNLNPSGGTGPYTISALTALPPGFALESGASLPSGAGGSYLLAGMPLASGTFSFTLHAQDTAGNIGARTFNLSVAPFTLFKGALRDGTVGLAYSEAIIAWDNTGPVAWSVAAGSTLPGGLSLSSGGVLSGTPAAAGNYAFALSATDASAIALNFNVSLRISNLSITDAAILPVAVEGSVYNHTFTATGAGSRTWSATGLPGGLTLSTAGVLSGTPTSPSVNNVTVTVTDGAVAFSKRFSLFVQPATPSLLDFDQSSTALPDVSVGQNVNVGLFPFDGVPPVSWAVAAGSTLPPGLALISGSSLPVFFNPADTVLAGMPSTAGDYSFALMATDAASTELRRTFTLHVSPMGILPGTPRNAVTGAPYAQQFVAVGGTPPYTFSMYADGLLGFVPPGLSLSAAGLLSGTPTSTGNYAIVLQAQDAAGNSFTQHLSISIANASGLMIFGENDAIPVGIGNHARTLETNGASTYTWLVVSGTLPPGISLMSGSIFGDPDSTLIAGQPTTPGSYTFVLRATDNANASNFAERAFLVEISPMQVVEPPRTLDGEHRLPPAEVGTAYTATLKVAGGTTPYTFSTLPFTPLPTGLSLSAAGVISGTPQGIGSYELVLIVTDSASQKGIAAINLLVTPPATPAPLEVDIDLDEDEGGHIDASVGVSFAFAIDRLVRGGVKPYTWAVASGSLPPGMAILPGVNTVSSYLGGIPTAAGLFTFSLTVSDAAGQTLTMPAALGVSPMALTPDAIPPGVVGTPYSVTLVPSGGTGPYTMQAVPFGDLPPGLSLASEGVLSGTPTYPGNFVMLLLMTDAADHTLLKLYEVTIDNAAGQSPAVALAPKPIQINYTLGQPAPSAVPVSVTTTSGTLGFDLAIEGVPGASLSAQSGTTPASVNLNVNPTGLTAGTYAGVLAVHAVQSANRIDAVPVTLVVTAPAAPTVTPSATTVAPGGTVTATIADGPGNAGDWVGLYAASAVDGAYLDWKYLNGTQSRPGSGVSGGAVAFTMPATPGTYNVRFFRQSSVTLLATSAPITVTAPVPPTITLSATAVAPGGTVTATIADGPGNAGDWVGLYAASAGDGAYLDWKYLNGTQSRPGSGLSGGAVVFTMPATPGIYSVRFFRQSSGTLLATSAPITVTAPLPPTITLSATTVAPGGTVTATIADGPGNAGDWVGLYAASAVDGAYLDWKYLNGTQSRPGSGVSGGAVAFTMPATPGTYNVRFFRQSSGTLLATSAPIAVTAPLPPNITLSATSVAPGGTVTATIADGPGNAGDWVGLFGAGAGDGAYLDWKYLNGTQSRPGSGVSGGGVVFTMPATPGTYNVRFFRQSSGTLLATSAPITVTPPVPPTITLSATTVAPGGTVTATIADGPGNAGDWVGLFAASAGDGAYLDWKYLNGTQSRPGSGVSGAPVVFTMPATPGTYNVRFFRQSSGTLATSATITVQ